LLLLGLDGAGKTTLAKRYINIPAGSQELYYTTPFMNIERINLPSASNLPCYVFDISGQGRYREMWKFYYPEVDGIFFVVDTADLERLSIVQELIELIIEDPFLKERRIPFVIVANKQDKLQAYDEMHLRKFLGIDKMKHRNKLLFSIKGTIATNGTGLNECFQFFENNIVPK